MRIGIAVLTVVLALLQASPVVAEETLEPYERAYFESLFEDAWRYFDSNLEKATSLPYDSTRRQPITSISNIGFYLAAASIAAETELISHEEGLARIQKTLDSLEQIEKWRGFPKPWVLVRSLKPASGTTFSYASHLSVLIGGLVVTANVFPEVKERINAYLGKMQFRDLYDLRTGWLKGGYNVKTNNFEIFQPWGHWYYKYFAGEGRLLSFYGISRKAFPESHWETLIRPSYERDGEHFFASGFEEPGLDAQYLAGLFLNEREGEMGESQKAYARYQMKRAGQIKAPVWGWASCENPRGWYQSYGEVNDEIVAPHASILASVYFPKEAYENLKKLEALGARPSLQNPDAERFGFSESLNWKTGAVSKNHLTSNKGMVFLSLANLLYNDVVHRAFQRDPMVRKGLRLLLLSKEVPPEIGDNSFAIRTPSESLPVR